MKNRTKELTLLLIRINNLLNEESKNIYNILSTYLQEQSHSFGFKPFSDLSDKIINSVDDINKNLNYSYLSYEQYDKIEYYENEENILKEIYYENIDNTKELLILIFNIIKELYSIDLTIGKTFSLFLTDNLDCSENMKHSFSYTNKVIIFIETNLDRYIYSDLNCVDENFDDANGWFYWFFRENNFGKKELECSIEENYEKIYITVDSYEKFFKIIKNQENII